MKTITTIVTFLLIFHFYKATKVEYNLQYENEKYNKVKILFFTNNYFVIQDSLGDFKTIQVTQIKLKGNEITGK